MQKPSCVVDFCCFLGLDFSIGVDDVFADVFDVVFDEEGFFGVVEFFDGGGNGSFLVFGWKKRIITSQSNR